MKFINTVCENIVVFESSVFLQSEMHLEVNCLRNDILHFIRPGKSLVFHQNNVSPIFDQFTTQEPIGLMKFWYLGYFQKRVDNFEKVHKSC